MDRDKVREIAAVIACDGRANGLTPQQKVWATAVMRATWGISADDAITVLEFLARGLRDALELKERHARHERS